MNKPTVVLLDRAGYDEHRLYSGLAIIDPSLYAIHVLSMTGLPLSAKPNELIAQHSVNLFDQQQVNAILDEIELNNGIDYIISLDEEHQLQCAQLREQYACYGRSSAQIEPFRHKVMMKERLQNQVNLPPFMHLSNYGDAMHFLSQYGKSVIKPITGLGSERTYVVHNAIDLRLQLAEANLTWSDFEIEKFIDGNMVHIDAVISKNQTALARVSQYLTSTLDYAAGQPLMARQMQADSVIHQQGLALLNQVIEAMGIGDAVVHLEAFYTHSESLTFCEIGLRPGGGGVRSQFFATTGVDLFDIFLKQELDQNYTLPKDETSLLAGYILYPPRSGQVADVSSLADFADEWIVHKKIYTEAGDSLSNTSCCLGKTAIFTVSGNSSDLVSERLETIRRRFRLEVAAACCA